MGMRLCEYNRRCVLGFLRFDVCPIGGSNELAPNHETSYRPNIISILT